MSARNDMQAVLIRLTRVEHAQLRTILRGDGLPMQVFFRQAAKHKIQQRAQAMAAMEGEPGEDV